MAGGIAALLGEPDCLTGLSQAGVELFRRAGNLGTERQQPGHPLALDAGPGDGQTFLQSLPCFSQLAAEEEGLRPGKPRWNGG